MLPFSPRTGATNRPGEAGELRDVRRALEQVFDEDLQLVVESIEKCDNASLAAKSPRLRGPASHISARVHFVCRYVPRRKVRLPV